MVLSKVIMRSVATEVSLRVQVRRGGTEMMQRERGTHDRVEGSCCPSRSEAPREKLEHWQKQQLYSCSFLLTHTSHGSQSGSSKDPSSKTRVCKSQGNSDCTRPWSACERFHILNELFLLQISHKRHYFKKAVTKNKTDIFHTQTIWKSVFY